MHVCLRSSVVTAICFLTGLFTEFSARAQDDQSPNAGSGELAAVAEPLLEELRTSLTALRGQTGLQTPAGEMLLADVAIFEKAATWMLRFSEFPKPEYREQLLSVLRKGQARAKQLTSGQAPWDRGTLTTIRGYVSSVDGSIQPYALTLTEDADPQDSRRWPLHVVLHGRADQMNEVNFIHRMDGRPLKVAEGLPPRTWIQLDVYGRGNNAYRWAGETDVFEAIRDVKRRFRIDEDRITLHGFSMGGAGAWHLGLHHPSVWSSVGPGAGFVDFYRYQKKNPDDPKQRLPIHQHQTLSIYDSVDYALNAFNVPVCTYGGENDPQLLASTTMSDAADVLDVPMTVLVGPKMGHAFDPESLRQFMTFHLRQSEAGRPSFGKRREIRFTTSTLKYNRCDWLAIEEMLQPYQPAIVEAQMTADGDVEISTSNIRALSVGRDAGTSAIIDGVRLECRGAAEGLLPDVVYVRTTDGWDVLDYEASRGFAENPELRKRHGLQGPIDDAFMSSFVCVRGTGVAWHENIQNWSDWSLRRFQQEFSQWMRGDVPVMNDTDISDDTVARNHLILFGDPNSNAVLKRIIGSLPVQWTSDGIKLGKQQWTGVDHGLVMIFPNPLNRSKYVVLNSGHTFHAKDFQASNAWLFPRLGDVAVLKLIPAAEAFEEQPAWAGIFGSDWRLPAEE